MIRIKKEPKDLYANLRVYERCFFCNKPTNTWHMPTNQPVCSVCAPDHSPKELINAKKDPVASLSHYDSKNSCKKFGNLINAPIFAFRNPI